MAQILNPAAQPFHPSSLNVITTEGFPSCVLSTSPVSGYNSETLFQTFPPSHSDILELQAVDLYNEMLALCEYAEEQEEHSRLFKDVAKRWEARRHDVVKVKPQRTQGNVLQRNRTKTVEVVKAKNMPVRKRSESFEAERKGKGVIRRRNGKEYASKNRVLQPR